MEVEVGPRVLTIHEHDHVLVSEPDATIDPAGQQGYFCADTRFVSEYRLTLLGQPPVLLNSSVVEPFSARYEFLNPEVFTTLGPLESGVVHCRLDRTVGSGIHEDYDLTNYSGSPVDLDLEIYVAGDYADIFDVRWGRLVRRGRLQTNWNARTGTLITTYRNEGFERGLRLQVVPDGSEAEFANGRISFRVPLKAGEHWHTCLLWMPIVDGRQPTPPARPCHALLGNDAEPDRVRERWASRVTHFRTAEPAVNEIIERAVVDLGSLRIHGLGSTDGDGEAWVPAAGVPWYVSLFGRDSLVVALQTLALSPRFALAALQALASLQGQEYDDERDLQPGKIEHEVRQGELAHLGLIPHTPYYGTHDATALFVWAASEVWRWTGDRVALAALRPHVEGALRWIDRDGDADGDGLQEYQTRAGGGGYVNQGWKDSGTAIVGGWGELPKLPIALCELQGYVIAAKRAWAEVLGEAFEDHGEARRLRAEATELAQALEDRFWWDDEMTYFLGLDGDKLPIETVASNPGHLLWAGAVDEQRADLVVARLLGEDMWTGWGIRTLSDRHPAYNPFSYQQGSVWPHDCAIAAAGFLRYGHVEEAWRVARGLFDAARCFHLCRLPEVFAGLEREPGSFPVQYLGANVPQAWASGAVTQLLAALAGLSPCASEGRLDLDPAIPDWLGEVEIRGLRVGSGMADLLVSGKHSTVLRAENLDVREARGPTA